VALRDRVRRVVRSRRTRQGTPQLSVVVPVYNVQDYVAAALDSILGQSYDDLEVVVVDDGSTDGSRAVVDGYVQGHPNVRLVASENRGLGAARNLGVRHCRGALLAFADSDDEVMPDAYAGMVSALDESGSDLVVGGVVRNHRDGVTMSVRQRDLHRERRLRLTVDDFPEVLADAFAWNKVFRRDFWDRAGLSFPEGVRYEDQPAMTRAYLAARSFDVIRRPVYLWRIREDSSSITQRRHELDDLRDRFLTKRQSLDSVRELGSPEVLRSFQLDALVRDMPTYLQHIHGCSEEYWRLLQCETATLWADAPSFAHARMPPGYRLAAWLVVQGRRAEAETVVDFAVRHRPLQVEVVERGEEMVAQLPFWDDPSTGIPAELYRLQEHERRIKRRQLAGTAPDSTGGREE
jgi:hypothetical protein